MKSVIDDMMLVLTLWLSGPSSLYRAYVHYKSVRRLRRERINDHFWFSRVVTKLLKNATEQVKINVIPKIQLVDMQLVGLG